MSDYRNEDYHLRDPQDPLRQDPLRQDPMRNDAKLDPDARAANVAWGWVAAAVFVVVVLAVAFGMNRSGPLTNTASNDATPPAATRMTLPPAVPGPTVMPAPATPLAPATPAPSQP